MTVKDMCTVMSNWMSVSVCTNIRYSNELALLQKTNPIKSQEFRKLVIKSEAFANMRVFRLTLENNCLCIFLFEEGAV